MTRGALLRAILVAGGLAFTAALGWAGEDDQLHQHARLARRNGNTLELTLASGTKLKLVNQGPPQPIKYTFVDYVVPIDRFLVSALYTEGKAHLLIDHKTGTRVILDEAPVFSPAFDRLITVSICDAYCPYRLQIWRLKQQPSVEWTFEPEVYWASGGAKWLDNSIIEITRETADPARGDPSKGNYVYRKEMLQLRLLPGGWAFTK